MATHCHIVKQVILQKHHVPTGNTTHRIGNRELPPPYQLRIVQLAGDPGYYLFYCDQQGNEQTDTYHDSINEAMEQAAWEFNVQFTDWRDISRA